MCIQGHIDGGRYSLAEDFSELKRGLISNTGLERETKASNSVKGHLRSLVHHLNVTQSQHKPNKHCNKIVYNVFRHAIKCFSQGKPLTELKQFNKIKG